MVLCISFRGYSRLSLFEAMESSTNTATSRYYLQYMNRRCKCGFNSDIKVSTTTKNPLRLFYVCRNRSCDFFDWCNPISTEVDPAQHIEDEVNSEEMRLGRIEREISDIHQTIKALEQSNSKLWGLVIPMGLLVFVCVLAVLPK